MPCIRTGKPNNGIGPVGATLSSGGLQESYPRTRHRTIFHLRMCALACKHDIHHLQDVNPSLKHVLIGLTVAVIVLGAHSGNIKHLRGIQDAVFKCQKLATGAKTYPSDSRPVWTTSKDIPPCTKVESDPGPPCLADEFQHHQDFEILPSASCAHQPVLCFYVRYWPRDPPSA